MALWPSSHAPDCQHTHSVLQLPVPPLSVSGVASATPLSCAPHLSDGLGVSSTTSAAARHHDHHTQQNTNSQTPSFKAKQQPITHNPLGFSMAAGSKRPSIHLLSTLGHQEIPSNNIMQYSTSVEFEETLSLPLQKTITPQNEVDSKRSTLAAFVGYTPLIKRSAVSLLTGITPPVIIASVNEMCRYQKLNRMTRRHFKVC